MKKYLVIYNPDRSKEYEVVVLDILDIAGLHDKQWKIYDKIANETCRLLYRENDISEYIFLTGDTSVHFST